MGTSRQNDWWVWLFLIFWNKQKHYGFWSVYDIEILKLKYFDSKALEEIQKYLKNQVKI